MNRAESKYFNTAAKMDEAFIGLLTEKDFQYITVKEICQRAGVHRSTFYLHYETMGDLLNESLQYLNKIFQDQFEGGPADIGSRIREGGQEKLYLVTPEYLTPYLQFIKEHKMLFQTVVSQSGVFGLDEIYASMFQHVFNPILERFHVPEEQRRYMMVFYIHGLMAVISEWLKNGCKEPVEQMIQTIERCVMDGRKGRGPL